ncbi:hypothetical protein BU23DRAFT_577208 [Bimuria novae-zelandiae CBS 107.79]|uniref:S-adenosyl-L-methionine-dependent methyltransferase n=1 Tax=Bimuria novae-zelandiae CBS 107.79 TaxID=1447943 RepID=A0A6A5VTN8_9PLEO|nr:hypothetical protein BU23DRAFT_577208 [Bimuria novae-zelandiae CBS 107.79]
MAGDSTTAPEDTYQGPRHDGEYERLRIQHEMTKKLMHGRLVLAPDLARQCAPTAKLVGADIAPDRFPRQLPANVSLFAHNIFDEWPKSTRNKFDLVHQRFVPPVCSNDMRIDVIRKLLACVRPGGYLMLHDADFDTIEKGHGHTAMERLRDVLRQSWSLLGYNLSPGPKLREEVLQIHGIEASIGKLPGFLFSAKQFSELKRDLREELEVTGNSYRTHVVWTRKEIEV